MENYQSQDYNYQTPVPNSTAVLVLGIVSIVMCCGGLLSLICGIIALILASKGTALYNSEPSLFTISSFNNLKAGKICAIVGVVLSGLVLIYWIFYFLFFGLVFGSMLGTFGNL
jgi:hypothetical protein